MALNFSTHEQKITTRIPRLYGTDDPQFQRTMGVLLGPTIIPGNRVETFNNGDEIFPAMLAAIRGAQQSITFETYIYCPARLERTLPRRYQNARALECGCMCCSTG